MICAEYYRTLDLLSYHSTRQLLSDLCPALLFVGVFFCLLGFVCFVFFFNMHLDL